MSRTRVKVLSGRFKVCCKHPLFRLFLFLLASQVFLAYSLHAAFWVITTFHFSVQHLVRNIHYEILFGLAAWISILLVKRLGEWPSVKDYFPKTKQLCWLFIGFGLVLGTMLLVAKLTTNNAGRSFWPENLHFPYGYVLTEVFLAALVEEVIYRGCVFSFLQNNYGTTAAVIGSCVTFGGLHILNGGSYGIIACFLITITSGLLLTGAFALTKNLYLPIGLHFGYDFAFKLMYGGQHYSPLFPTLPPPTFALFVQITEFYIGVGLLFFAYRRGYWQPYQKEANPIDA